MASKRLGAYKVPFKDESTFSTPQETPRKSLTAICETSINKTTESDKIKSFVQKETSLKGRKRKTKDLLVKQKSVKIGNSTDNNDIETEIKTYPEEKGIKIFDIKFQKNTEWDVTEQDIQETLQAILHKVVRQVCEDKLTEPFQNQIITDFKMMASNVSASSKCELSLIHPNRIDASKKIAKQDTRSCNLDMKIQEGTSNTNFKTLKIFSMSALDLEKENQLKKEEIWKINGNLSARNGNMLQDETKDGFYENFVSIAELCIDHHTNDNTGISSKGNIHTNGSANNFSVAPFQMHSFTKNVRMETEDKIQKKEPQHIKSSSGEEVQNNENKNKENIPPNQNSLGIFTHEDLITENIIFREKDENEEDIIPTGIFQPLNEIFQYNEKNELFEPKLEIVQEISSNQNKTTKKSEDKNDETKSGSLKKNSINDHINNSNKTDCKVQDNIKETNDKKQLYEDNHEGKSTLENAHSNEDLTISNKNTKDSDLSKVERNIDEIINGIDECESGSCMEMDDDFNLTASQLSMLEADEKMEIENYSNGKCSTGQQTDIGGVNFINEQEILNQLSYLRCSIEYIRERIDKEFSR